MPGSGLGVAQATPLGSQVGGAGDCAPSPAGSSRVKVSAASAARAAPVADLIMATFLRVRMIQVMSLQSAPRRSPA